MERKNLIIDLKGCITSFLGNDCKLIKNQGLFK